MSRRGNLTVAQWGPLGAVLCWLGSAFVFAMIDSPRGGQFESQLLSVIELAFVLVPAALLYQGAFIYRYPERAAHYNVQMLTRYSRPTDYSVDEAPKFALLSTLSGLVLLLVALYKFVL